MHTFCYSYHWWASCASRYLSRTCRTCIDDVIILQITWNQQWRRYLFHGILLLVISLVHLSDKSIIACTTVSSGALPLIFASAPFLKNDSFFHSSSSLQWSNYINFNLMQWYIYIEIKNLGWHAWHCPHTSLHSSLSSEYAYSPVKTSRQIWS